MIQILHITNTDVEFDSRIRKELNAFSLLPGTQVSAIGVPINAERGPAHLDGFQYRKLYLHSRTLKIFPRAFRYLLELAEFTIKATNSGSRFKPDIVHCHDTFSLPVGWILKTTMGCLLVYDAHELESNKNGQYAILSYATLFIERFCWKYIDLLVSVSDSIISWYKSHLGPIRSVLVLNSPITVDLSNATTTTIFEHNYFRIKYSIPSDHLIFVYLGILAPGRGIQICLDAFARGPKSAHAIFIGSGILEESIKELAALHNNIHYHPAVAHDQVVSLARNADFGLCLIENASLSDYYCLPNKLFEYCFAGMPVLASNFPEINRLVARHSLGICCSPDVNSLETAISEIIKQRPNLAASNISTLSWKAQIKRLKFAYAIIISESIRRRLLH